MGFWNYLLLCSSFGTIIEIGETEKIIACENNILQLDCNNGNTIYVCEANYGRLKPWSYDNCDHPLNRDSNQNCRHASSLQIVRDNCQGHSSCSFVVRNSRFSPDPCGGVFKYLEVNYTCTTGSQTPTSCDNIITTTEEVIITTLQQTTEGTTTTKTTLPQTTQDETTIQTSEQTTKDSTIEETSTTTESTKQEQTTEYETTSMGPATTTTTTKDTSTDDTTQVNADQTTSLEPQCQCTCVEQNITLEEKLNNIKKELVVKKSTLSSRRRKLISAGDNRTSAKQIGLIGATFLGVFFIYVYFW